jgi:hypothetical protein
MANLASIPLLETQYDTLFRIAYNCSEIIAIQEKFREPGSQKSLFNDEWWAEEDNQIRIAFVYLWFHINFNMQFSQFSRKYIHPKWDDKVCDLAGDVGIFSGRYWPELFIKGRFPSTFTRHYLA